MPRTLPGAIAALLLLACLAGCARPPASAYVSDLGANAGARTAGIGVGKNAAGEACTAQPGSVGPTEGRAEDIFCGTWQQPSARVQESPAGDPAALATSGPWRTALDTRFACQAPTSSTILDHAPALVMQCTRLVGGWPHLAIVATIGKKTYLADGVLPSTPAMERAIGIMAGLLRPGSNETMDSGTEALTARRLAAEAFSSGDVGRYDDLMSAGTRANLAEDFAAAETAFRAALALQQKALGPDNPNTVAPLMHIALQVSDQGRFSEADALFARADRLVNGAADPTAKPRLLHYEALNDINQGRYKQALALLDRAEAGYAALLPPEILDARPVPPSIPAFFRRGAALNLSSVGATQDLLIDPTVQTALMGVVEVRRNRAIALRGLGQTEASVAAMRSARALALANGLTASIIDARLFRTFGTTVAAIGDTGAASSDLAESADAFRMSLPRTRPVAETELLRAGAFARAGEPGAALDLCRSAVALLRSLKAGTRPALLDPCLDVYAATAAKMGKDGQPLLAEMFEAAQLAQGGVTSQQIAQATARLSVNAKDPKVAEAIRKRQDASNALDALYRERDQLVRAHANAKDMAGMDKEVADARTALADADAALQAAAPNYGQLVQQVSPAKDVLAALRPGEAFAAIVVSTHGGWTFLLRDGRISVAATGANLPQTTELVQRIRASIEPTTQTLPVFDTKSAHLLYTDLFGGVANELKGASDLIVVPTGPLLSLPFEVLLTGEASPTALAAAPWLVRQFPISHVPAAANFVALRKIAGGSRATRPWFGFGDFRPVTLAQAEKTFPGSTCADSAKLFAGLPTLPYAKRELEAARALLGASPSDELLGPAFTAAAVEKADLKDYRILHFAAHALLPSDLKCQSEPAIVTSAPAGATSANGALLTASDVVGLNLDADAVILSACNSGGPGGSTAGESLSGLARAFFYAGARALLVTHWSVNDQAAAFLIAETLQNLRQHPEQGMAAALRQAQLGVLAEAGRSLPAEIAHPFFWAPFALIGVSGRVPGAQAALSAASGA